MMEQHYLTYTLAQIEQELTRLTADITKKDASFLDLQRYLVDYKAELDKFEVYDYEQSMRMLDKQGFLQVMKRQELQKLLDSPYFGSFHFQYDGDDDAEPFYIGRFGFQDDTGATLVYDWRAPVCHMYYEFELGEAYYEAMNQRFCGTLQQKQQIKIERGRLQYVLDSSLTIQDELLQQAVVAAGSDKMKTIVTSIQREQNKIVRHEAAHTLIIQGIAGSGKTAVALHRIAYFLYKFRDTLKPERIFILSPNKVFGDYISSVLPELGEQPIRSFTLDELTAQLLPSAVTFTSFEDEMKHILQNPTSPLARRAALKGNFAFVQQLDAFLQQLDTTMLQDEPIKIADVTFTARYLQRRFYRYRKEPVFTRLQLLVDDILEALKKRRARHKIPSRPDILRRLKKRLRYTAPLQLYKDFLATLGDDVFVFKKKHFECNDVYPYLYVVHYMKGIKTYDMTQYFVLDEMQDYTPIQYAVLKNVFACKRTIIGDFQQALLPYETICKDAFTSLFTDIHYTELTTTYRSSYDIAMYAKQFMRSGELRPIERYTQPPAERYYSTFDELVHEIEIACTAHHKTTAIICQTDAQVAQLSHALRMPLTILDGQSKTFEAGVVLTTVQYAKGLEFDAVIVPFVDHHTYYNDFHKGLLYIATTRAMHELTMMIDATKPSPLLKSQAVCL